MSLKSRAAVVLPRLIAAKMGGALKLTEPLRRRPRVSVVIPCYNYGRYLRTCVESALRHQHGVDVEIIIVDDKSTDNSLVIAQAIAVRHPEVSVIAQPVNMGAVATYNHGLTLSRGEYVVLLSADDLLTPGALTRAAKIMEMQPSVGLVYGAAPKFHDIPPAARSGHGDWIHWPGQQWLRIRCQSGYNVIASPEVMMRSSVLRQIGLYRTDLPHAGDLEMWLRAASVSDVGFLIATDQAFYRQHQTNMHKATFKSGTHEGGLIDLEQRAQAFQAALGNSASKMHAQLLATARASIARHAVDDINYAYARGQRSFPVSSYEALARDLSPHFADTAEARALTRRKRLGMMTIGLPLHPVWAASVIALRMVELGRRARRFAIGV